MRAPSLTLVPFDPRPALAPQGEEWLDAWRGAVALGWDSLAKLAALSDLRQLRSWWLADLRQVTAEYLRSPEFLALMKFNLTLLARRTTPPSAF
jgi:hypothetical protein